MKTSSWALVEGLGWAWASESKLVKHVPTQSPEQKHRRAYVNTGVSGESDVGWGLPVKIWGSLPMVPRT